MLKPHLDEEPNIVPASPAPELKLHLGCGDVRKEGYLNIDIRPTNATDLVADVTAPLPGLQPESAVRIEAYDVLEHFPQRSIRPVLELWLSYLQPGGTIVIRVPDLRSILTELLQQTLPLQTGQWLIYGGQENEHDFHKAGFDGSYLEGLLMGLGCSRILQRIHENHNVTLVAEK